MGTLAVDFHFVAELIPAVAGCAEHSGKRILGRVAGAAAEGIEHTGAEDETEGKTLVACGQIVETTVEQFVADAHDTDALTGIRESLGTTDKQHVVVCVAGYGRPVRKVLKGPGGSPWRNKPNPP